jgi:hypothetical protein
VSIFGGRGRLHGVVAGVLLIGVIASALRLEGITVNVINIITGLLLVASVVSTSVLARISRFARPSTGRPAHRSRPRAWECRRDNYEAPCEAVDQAGGPHGQRCTRAHRLRRRGRRGGLRGGGGGGGGDELTVTFLPKNLGNPYFDTSDAGGKEAVEEFGGTFEEVGPQEASPDAQVQYINTAAQQGVSALVVSANDPKAICDAIAEAQDAGTKVVTFDSDTSPGCRDLYVNQASAEGIAKAQVDLISEQIGAPARWPSCPPAPTPPTRTPGSS